MHVYYEFDYLLDHPTASTEEQQVKPPSPWAKKLRPSMLMCLRDNCY